MTLRDHFAGQAIPGLVSLGSDLENTLEELDTQADVVASQAYAIADAMLKERSKTRG